MRAWAKYVSPVQVPKGEVRQVHMPVVPVKDGCVDVKISVLTFIWSDSHTLTMCSTVRLIHYHHVLHGKTHTVSPCAPQ